MTSVVSFGAMIVDTLGHPFTRVPDGQQIEFMEQIRLTVAGTAAAPALTLGKLGVEVAAAGRIGKDQSGLFLTAGLEAEGVDTSTLVTDDSAQTSSSMLLIRPDGSRPALHVMGANAKLSAEDVPWDVVKNAQIFHMGGAFVLPSLDGGPMREVLQEVKRLGLTVTMDFLLNPRDDAMDVVGPSLQYVDYLMPNIEEAQWLTGSTDRPTVIRQLHEKGVGCTVLTLGEEGVSVAPKDESETVVPAVPIEVVDTTGAGDAFTAGFISGLVEALTPVDAARRGTATGALCASGLGSDHGIVDLAQVEAFMAGGGDR